MTAWCNGAWVRSDTGVGLVEADSRGIVALVCVEMGQSTSSDALIAAVVAVNWSTAVVVAVVGATTAVVVAVVGASVAVDRLTASAVIATAVAALMGGERGDGILASTVCVGNSPLGKIASSRAPLWVSRLVPLVVLGVAVDRSTAVAVVAVEWSTAVLGAVDWSTADGSFGFKWFKDAFDRSKAVVAVDWSTASGVVAFFDWLK